MSQETFEYSEEPCVRLLYCLGHEANIHFPFPASFQAEK